MISSLFKKKFRKKIEYALLCVGCCVRISWRSGSFSKRGGRGELQTIFWLLTIVSKDFMSCSSRF